MKDHYKTLGISASATASEIKKAYRSLAFKYHPDKNPGDTLSEARFREIQEAYEALSDSSKRAAYDDDRWVTGMGSKAKNVEVITPAWLVNVCVQLNGSLSDMDTHRMSQRALQLYMLLVLEDEHIAILQLWDDTSANRAIINELLKAAKRLDVKYLDEIEAKLIKLAGNDEEMLQAIDEKIDERIRSDFMEKLLPWFVLIVTLGLCIAMYYYGGLK